MNKCFCTHQFSSGSLSSLLLPRCLVWSLDTPRRSPLLKHMISDYLVINGNHWPLEFLDPTSWRKPESCTVWVFGNFPTQVRLTPSFLSGASSAYSTVWRSARHLLWGLPVPFSFKSTRFSLLCTICTTFCTICTSRTFCTGLLQLGKELSSAELLEGVEKRVI